MPDLATALQQVLRQVREETLHDPLCDWPRWCSCDRLKRVEAEQARRWAASIEATLEEWHPAPGEISTRDREITYKYALGAAQQERGSA